MENTKQKTLAECMDEVARNTDYNVLNVRFKNWKHFYNHCRVLEMWRFYSEKLNEAAELYAGQTKQDYESYSAIEKAVEIAKRTVIKAKVVRDGLVKPKQSEPVSLEVENVIISLCNTLENIQSGIESGERPEISDMQKIYDQIYSAVNFIKQSQQTASVAFLSEDEINKLCPFVNNGSPRKLFINTAINIQSELRKRVIDLNDFAGWLFGGHDKNVEESIVNDYINNKTK